MEEKKSKREINRTMFCPKCKSIDIKKELNVLLVAGAPQKWICNNCGFLGYVFPEKIKYEELKNLNKK